jgi:hypothetical protein
MTVPGLQALHATPLPRQQCERHNVSNKLAVTTSVAVADAAMAKRICFGWSGLFSLAKQDGT